ncbi:MAG: ATP-dependent Clp protease ATP-binding subunit, partial [Polyangiaceae bacterium]|nr:ATP-dependent Clp protease ATP-binding subunit [Polyangiaceae bacterium]
MGEQETTLQLERYTAEARGMVAGAQALADERKHAQVEPIHLLVRAVDRTPGVADVFRRAGAEPGEVLAAAEAGLRGMLRTTGAVAYLSRRFLDLLGRAEREADRDKSASVDIEHLLHALSQEIRGEAGELFTTFNLSPGAFRPHISVLKTVVRGAAAPSTSTAKHADPVADFTRDLVARARGGDVDPVIGRDAEVRRLLQVLERRGKNHPLIVGEPGVGKTALVRALAARLAAGDVPTNLADLRLLELDTGALVAGARLRGELEERVKALVQALSSEHERCGAVLVVDSFDTLLGQGAVGAGVGELLKPVLARGTIRFLGTTTPEGVRKIQDRDAALLRSVTIIAVDPPTVDRAVEVLRGIATRYERHHHVRIGESAITASVQLAKRYLQDRELPDSAIDLLDETAARKRVEIEGVPAEVDDLMRRLESVRAQQAALADDEDEASQATLSRLRTERAELEPKVRQAKAALESRRGALAAVQVLRRELSEARAALEKARDEKAFARLGELEHVTIPDLERRLEAAEAAVQRVGGSDGSYRVTEQDVALTLEAWTGIPVAKMLEAETDKLLRMEERLGQRVVGQDEALKAVSKAVRRGRVGLRDPGRPIGSFLFLGPSGVGKTELAKALAEFLFDDELALTRLDMSEFMERHMAQRLLGAPPGYVDSEHGGFLTEAVRRRPFSVLLFDEVEKAHSDVFNLLLQVLEDGRLTDGRGRTADFSNTVVIMTSNIGAKRILDTDAKLFETEDGREALRDVLLNELRSFFRPEFLNRVDDVIVFRSLSKEHLRGIVDIQLRRLDALLRDRHLRVQLSEQAKQRLVELGYDPAFGARPLRRAILREV